MADTDDPKRRTLWRVPIDQMVRYRRVLSVVTAFALAAAGCSFLDRTVHVTQCLWASGQVQPNSKQAALYFDKDRACYGLRWTIPKRYYGPKYISFAPVSETIGLRISRTEIVPDAKVSGDRWMSLYNEINLQPSPRAGFASKVSQTKDNYARTSGLADTGRNLSGFRVYDQTRPPVPNQYRDVFLFPRGRSDLYANCMLRPGAALESSSPETACEVTADFNDHVYLQYWIQYADVGRLIEINAAILKQVQQFSTNRQDRSGRD